MNRIATVIRIILTICLIAMVYLESGIWTSVAISLISISFELHAFSINKLNKVIFEHITISDMVAKTMRKRADTLSEQILNTNDLLK